MTEIADTIEAGRLAWDRVRESKRTSFDDWIAIGRALIVGRAWAMQMAKANRPVGSKYNGLMYRWLLDHGLAEITPSERYRSIKVIENLEEIQLWRDGLPEAKRLRLNYPAAVMSHWSRASAPGRRVEPRARPDNPPSAESGKPSRYKSRPNYWSQDILRSAAEGIRMANSRDVYIVARAVLDAAFPDRDALIAVVNEAPPHPSYRRDTMPAHADA